MSVRTLERRLTRLQAKQRRFDSWTDEELAHAIELHFRAADELTPEDEKQLQRYLAKMPPVSEEVAALPEELVEKQIQELRDALGYDSME